MKSALFRAGFLLAGTVLSAACAAPQVVEKAKPDPNRRLTSADYFPVAAGSSWAYVIERHLGEGSSQPLLATTRVVNSVGHNFELQTGSERAPYELRATGVYKKNADYFVLEDPIEKDRRWPIMDGKGEVRISEVEQAVIVPAGRFERCIVVTEELFKDQRVEWTYAPGVGAIEMRVYMLDGPEPQLVLEGKLQAFKLGASD